MSAAATRWISPFWGIVRTKQDVEQGAESQFLASTHVFILNLGKQDKVTVNWFDGLGNLAKHDESTPNFHTVSSWTGPDFGEGWLRIVSSTPVLAWGVTPLFPTDGPVGDAPTNADEIDLLWVNMSFYPEDPIAIPDIPDIPLPIP